MATCNHCFDGRKELMRLRDRIGKLCMVFYFNADKHQEAYREEVSEKLEALTKEYARRHQTQHQLPHHGWNSTFLGLFLDQPNLWAAILDDFERNLISPETVRQTENIP